jgi:outer membrane protein OmpA-like peptidoglycan-associated protein
MKPPQFFLLASAALFAATAAQQPVHGADVARALKVAQAAPQGEKNEHGNKQGHEANKNKPGHKPDAKEHGKPSQAEHKAEKKHARPAAKSEKPKAKPAAAAQENTHHAEPRQANEQRSNEKHQRSENEQHKQNRKHPVAAQKEAPAAGQPENRHKKAEEAKPEQAKPNQAKEIAKPAPQNSREVEQYKGAQPPAKPAAQQPVHNAPKSAQQPAPVNAPTAAAVPSVPTKPRNASAFIRRQGEKPGQGLNEVRRSRHETREGNRVVIREGDRTIEQENNRAIIRHSESDRFAVGARHVNVEHHDGRTVTIVVRPNGVRIVSTTDRYGHLIRRVRRDPHGREIVIIDDSRFAPRRRDEIFVEVPPPRIHDRDRYIIEADRADRRQIYEAFIAPPITRLHGHYTVDQVRYSYPLREYMPRVDLDIHFDTGSWQLTSDQIDRLAEIAAALNEAIDHNPREVYLIEGHTDAVGSREDNLSLSDRRAEAIAVALTEQFHVPPENLVTQGYGEEHLKVQTQGPSRANRRVTVRRITPLIAQAESQGPR